MKRSVGTRKHALAGVLLVLAAAGWNIQYHRVQAAKTETAKAEHSREHHAWRKATPEERQAAIDSITKQLDAFQQDDYAKAIEYQSASLKENFRSAQSFGRMIKTNYPQFARYKSVEFGRSRANNKGEHIAIRLKLTGQDGVTVKALYMMVREGNIYRVGSVIGGVQEDEKSPPRPSRALPGISA